MIGFFFVVVVLKLCKLHSTFVRITMSQLTSQSLNFSWSQPDPVHPKFKKASDDFNAFMCKVQDMEFEYQCYKCGQTNVTHTFTLPDANLLRSCAENIDADVAKSCGRSKDDSEEKNTKTGLQQVSNIDLEKDYCTFWEDQKNHFMYKTWNGWNVTDYMSDCKALCTKNRLQARILLEKHIIESKKAHFRFNHNIDNVNEYILSGSLRRLNFYLQCIKYYDIVNKYGNYQLPCTTWGICHACGMKYYMATQYERSYVNDYVRKVMNLCNYHVHAEAEENFFVCGVCINHTLVRGWTQYNEAQKKTILHKSDWSSLPKKDTIIFSLGNLDDKKYPLYFAWFDMMAESWCNGRILKVIDAKRYTLEVKVVNGMNQDQSERKRIVSFGSRSDEEYFIYQRPSCQESPLHRRKWIKKYMLEHETIIDTTPPQFPKDWQKDKLYPNPDKNTISLHWQLYVVNRNTHQQVYFYHVMHMQSVYELLKHHKLLNKIVIPREKKDQK